MEYYSKDGLVEVWVAVEEKRSYFFNKTLDKDSHLYYHAYIHSQIDNVLAEISERQQKSKNG